MSWFFILSLGCPCPTHDYTHCHRWVHKILYTGCSAHFGRWGLPNHKCNLLMHSHQIPIFFWCVCHHCACVVHNAQSIASYHCCFDTDLPTLSKSSSPPLSPSYVGSSLHSIVTYHSDLIIMLQFSIETSFNQFCQCSICSFESKVQELSHSHEILPFSVDFTLSYSCAII